MPGEDSLTTLLAEDVLQLDAEELDTDWENQVVEDVLEEMLQRMEDLRPWVQWLMKLKLSARETFRRLWLHVGAVVNQVTQGLMCVPNYQPKRGARQQVLLYVGTHWVELQTQVFYDFVRQAVKRMGLEEHYAEGHDFMELVFQQVSFSESKTCRARRLRSEVRINLENGTLVLSTRRGLFFRDHRPEDYFRYCLPYRYLPEAECPEWHRFLDRVLPDASVQRLLAEYIGYCFTRGLKLEKMAVLYGGGANGKSVTLDVIERLVGRANVSNVSLSALTQNPEERALIEHHLINVSHESDSQLNNDMLKKLVSGEPATVRVLYEGTHTMYDYAKLITSFNRLPPSEQTNGFFRRWLLFPFEVTIPEEEQNPDLTMELCRELPGILNWVLEALQGLLKRRNFSKSETCRQALSNYMLRSNSVLLFLSERVEADPGGRVGLKHLYNAYGMYCLEEGLQSRFRRGNFRDMVRQAGYKEWMEKGCVYYPIRLLETNED